jgi:hypothetical protein
MQARVVTELVYVLTGMKELIVVLSNEQNFWGHIQVLLYSPNLEAAPIMKIGT